MDGAVLEEAHELAGLLFGATELTRARFQELCDSYEMTPVQARALMALATPTPMRALAEVLRCDPSNVTGLADRLEHRGLVERAADPADRRVKLLMTTGKGDAVRRELEAALLASSPLVQGLTATERRQLRRLLVKMQREHERDGA